MMALTCGSAHLFGRIGYTGGTAHSSGTGAALTRNPAPWATRTSLKEGHRA